MLFRASGSEAAAASRQQASVVGLEILERRLEQPRVRDYHDIDAIEPARVLATPENLSNQSFGAVPPHRIAKLFRGDDPEAGAIRLLIRGFRC